MADSGKALAARYKILEMDIVVRIHTLIQSSGVMSKTHDIKVMPVNLYDYVEMGMVNDELVFLDKHGHVYSLHSDATTDDLIELIQVEEKRQNFY
jgi:hypothetical protein